MTHDLDRLLKAAGPRPGDRPRYDLEAGRRYITEKQAARRAASAAACCRARVPGPAAPPGASTAKAPMFDDAGRDLRALAKLVINEPDAYEWLDALVDRWEPRGGLVFGCLLDLTGQPYDAQWWWQFSAGAGDLTAAYCLYLHHVRMGELRDAEHWFHQAARLDDGTRVPLAPALPDLPGYPHLGRRLAPPLPDTAGLRSPDNALREAIDGLPERQDDMCGPFSLPTGDIAHQLQELAAAN
ncbi:hypothetical protein ACIF6L_34125 [Kitasatospora sp. NPDC086009]|uniref:hypothetical protein n=1 Tax=unclassified Kitasatospora TaxID=2633591 RepID=UPI0037C73AB8